MNSGQQRCKLSRLQPRPVIENQQCRSTRQSCEYLDHARIERQRRRHVHHVPTAETVYLTTNKTAIFSTLTSRQQAAINNCQLKRIDCLRATR